MTTMVNDHLCTTVIWSIVGVVLVTFAFGSLSEGKSSSFSGSPAQGGSVRGHGAQGRYL